MSLWAIIPVKPLRRGKSRLSSVLTEDERAMLNYSMLSNVLLTLRSISQIDQILVVSRDTSALSLAREYGVRTVQEDGRPNLNTALKRATAVAQIYSVDNILVLPADLPLITSQDIENIIKKAGDPPVMVIAPDRRMDGTNALYVSPAGTIEYSYGPVSYTHLRAHETPEQLVCRLLLEKKNLLYNGHLYGLLPHFGGKRLISDEFTE